ncbi:PIG-L deacetylase family protein, partial [Klebsiella pneumoniae]
MDHEQEGLLAHKVLDVLLTGSNDPNYVVDISDVFDQKIESLKAHRSQVGDPDALRERMTTYA